MKKTKTALKAYNEIEWELSLAYKQLFEHEYSYRDYKFYSTKIFGMIELLYDLDFISIKEFSFLSDATDAILRK